MTNGSSRPVPPQIASANGSAAYSPASNGSSIAIAQRRGRELAHASSGNDGGSEGGGENQATNILSVAWRQRWVIAACCVLAIAAGIAYLINGTPIYASSSVIYVKTSQPKLAADVMANVRTTGFIFTQCQILTSTAILQSALARPEVANLETLVGTANPIGTLKSIVAAQPDKQGELISVTAESPNPTDAAKIANALVESYIQYVNAQHKSSAVEVLKSLQLQYERYETAYNANTEAMLRLKQENPDLITTADRAMVSRTRFGSAGEELTAAQLRQVDLSTAQSQAIAVKDDPYRLKRVLDQFKVTTDTVPAVDPTLMAEYREQRNVVDDLTSRLGSQHQSVRDGQRQLARIEAEVADATRSSVASLMALLDQAIASNDARIQALTTVATTERTGSNQLSSKQFEYEQLVQKNQNVERQLEMIDARMKDINVAEDVGAMTVDVLEAAQPGFKVRPLPVKVLGIALMAGLMGGMGLALLRDTLDHRLRSVEEIIGTLDVPVLGAIPHIGSRGSSGGKRVSPGDRGRFVHLMPKSAVAEAFRTLRTAVYFAIPDSTPGKTILVTSPAPGDGKSTTASNIAIAFAQAGRRVLLIDADCRRPTQARLHAVESVPGLADVLAGGVGLADAIQQSPIQQLSLLPAGNIPPNPAELLDSPAFRTLLADVAEQFDQVIIDSPPIVPVTDARIIAALADATLLVLRAERSTRRLANHARDALATVNARLIGVVVGDVPRGSKNYGYYGAGRYGYTSVQVGVGTSANGSYNAGESSPAPVQPRERVAGELVADPTGSSKRRGA